ncbi:hypothetical protein EJ04DRAFT_564416 [Polyplosphaeria fusca]|uniref:Uncharacterized protein n=1 Tax=Polyplosphaeria fusca TaxID=682080 RepID=A0A9P4V3G0_9PLEO|nr:hypothetical protein EJ04DRAFT_564416 [Polyplosphaeria fusca]
MPGVMNWAGLVSYRLGLDMTDLQYLCFLSVSSLGMSSAQQSLVVFVMAIVYDQLFSPEEEASFNVDALVNDPYVDSATPIPIQLYHQPRRATPTIPPGFTASAVPKTLQDPPSRPLSRAGSAIVTPAVPVIPITPARTAKASKSEKTEAASPSKAAALTKADGSKKKTSDIGPNTAAGVVKQEPGGEQKEERAVPKADHKSPSKTAKSKGNAKKNQSAAQNESKDVNSVEVVSRKQQPPTKLDIAAATTASENDRPATGSKTETQAKKLRAVSLASETSAPSSPVGLATASPVKRSTAPRTLRVVPTPKADIPPPLSAASAASVPHVPTVDKLRSRQASIASINFPGTPASELISDNASITSASMSRANSPPPIGGKVGSAPVRKKTKSQVKKERQERARQIAEEAQAVDEHVKSEAELEHAPIVGRKKKAKKPATATKPTQAEVASQPPSPKADVEEEEAEPEEVPIPAPKKTTKAKPAVSSPRMSQAVPDVASPPDQHKEKGQFSALQLVIALQKDGELPVSNLEFFKPPSASLAHARAAQGNMAPAPPDVKIHISEADLDALSKKKPVRLRGQDGKSESNTLITPEGRFFWGLAQDYEENALRYEKRIRDCDPQFKFNPRKQTARPHAYNINPQAPSKDVLPALATALKEAGAKLSKSTAASPSQQMPKLDPTSTLLGSTSLPLPPLPPVQTPSEEFQGVQLTPDLQNLHLPPAPPPPPQPQQTPADAIAYLNQFVLPQTDDPPPSTPPTEMAAVGGPPGAGLGNMAVNVNKIAKAAKAVAEGGVVGAELEGMGSVDPEVLGGVVVQGLEALVGAGLGLGLQSNSDLGVDEKGNITLGGQGLDVHGLMQAIESGGGLTGLDGARMQRRGRKSVLSVEEAEQALLAAKKDHDAIDKKLNAVMKRNKRAVMGKG